MRIDLLSEKPKRITVDLLDSLGACSEEIEHFRELFPKGANITVNSYVKAVEDDLELSWFMARLPGTFRRAYAKAQDKHGATFSVKLEAAGIRMYDGKITGDQYNDQHGKLDKEYDRSCAKSFVELWKAWKPRKRRKR